MTSLLTIPGTCEVCGTLFPSKKELRAHGKTCKVACGQCAEIFANKTALAESAGPLRSSANGRWMTTCALGTTWP